MILLSVRGVTKHYGPDPVLDGVTFDLRPGEHVGLVGPNGAGKTTLMRIVAGLEELDNGELERHASVRIGFLEQQPQFKPDRTVWQEAATALEHLKQLAIEAEQAAQAMATAGEDTQQQRRLAERFDRLQHELHHRDAYQLDHRIAAVLSGLGFAEETFAQPVGQLSGGQQNRLLLAKLLLEEPDLMLLDEPSNHLDLQATEWLENTLSSSSQALLVVSHDRYLLDRVTNRTLELVHGTVDDYPGNFSAYRRLKDERLEVQRRTYEKQQTEIAKLQDFIRRHHAGQKSTQAEDRRKKLERIEQVAAPRELSAPAMGFPPASRTGDIVLRAEHVSKVFDWPLFNDLSFDVLRGEKWGILGPNGTGKTTLVHCILGREPLTAGRVTFGAGVQAAFVDQQLQCISDELPVIEAIRPDGREYPEGERRDLLARFGIIGDMAFQQVSSLSGGQRSRTALAWLAATKANLLILDEPTNHLDLWARESLEGSLRKFEGSVLFVSHDRYFLNQVADHLLIVEPDRFRVVEGNYDTYVHLVGAGLAGQRSADSEKPADTGAAKAKEADNQPQRRKKRFPYRKIGDVEADIHQKEARIDQLHQSLIDPDVLRDGERVKKLKQQLEDEQQALQQLYEHWEELG